MMILRRVEIIVIVCDFLWSEQNEIIRSFALASWPCQHHISCVLISFVLFTIETRLQEDLQEIKDTMFSQETSSLARLVKSVVGRARRCIQVGTTMVDKSHDPIYRNGLMVYINKLEKGKCMAIVVGLRDEKLSYNSVENDT